MIPLLVACSDDPDTGPGPDVQPPLDAAVVDALSMTRIRADVELVAGDETGGRVPGSPGHRFVGDWLAGEMADAGLEPVGSSFVVEAPLTLSRQRLGLDEDGQIYEVPLIQTGRNLLGLRTGDDPALLDEVVLLVAHYDHLGVNAEGAVYNGAFDDGTAVCALVELARALEAHDVRFPRTLGFLFTDAEEDGLGGATAWAADPTVPLADVVAALSVDPIGRPLLTDYRPLFTIGAERSPEITGALLAVAPFVDTEIRRLSRTPVVGYASDQDVFWELDTPALWITSGGMSFYHTVDDDPITIDYRSVQEHLGAVAQLAAALAVAPSRPVDLGPQPLSVDDLREAVATLEGTLGSAELTDEERALGEQYRDSLTLDANQGDPEGALPSYGGLLLYVIQLLAPAHPGPIPPPFPE